MPMQRQMPTARMLKQFLLKEKNIHSSSIAVAQQPQHDLPCTHIGSLSLVIHYKQQGQIVTDTRLTKHLDRDIKLLISAGKAKFGGGTHRWMDKPKHKAPVQQFVSPRAILNSYTVDVI